MPSIKRGGNGNREVGSGPRTAAWIIKEGFVPQNKGGEVEDLQ